MHFRFRMHHRYKKITMCDKGYKKVAHIIHVLEYVTLLPNNFDIIVTIKSSSCKLINQLQ